VEGRERSPTRQLNPPIEKRATGCHREGKDETQGQLARTLTRASSNHAGHLLGRGKGKKKNIWAYEGGEECTSRNKEKRLAGKI